MSDAFFELHRDLPRQGPGLAADVHWALAGAGVGGAARVLDAGCGPGADLETLAAALPEARVTGVDLHAPFVEEARARTAHLGDRVAVREGSMASAGGPYDFIWCAGALYFLGITEGLKVLRETLAPGGSVAFSELVYLVDRPDPELQQAIASEYPAIGDRSVLAARIRTAGFDPLQQRVLSDAAWAAYHDPLEARIARLRPGADAALAAVLDAAEAEIALWRRYRGQLGYALSLVRPQ